ncbi:class I SAM-dependent methyltransferase [Acidimicrobiaceae bacterium]|nr:class I SAM-dependent methyltransferase [Acidimicrobiaceae bacterium]
MNYVIWILRKLFDKLSKSEISELLPYRKYLFDELMDEYGQEYFSNKRILEIGPKDGDDTFRLEKLNPEEIVMFDLPDKSNKTRTWIDDIKVKNQFFEENFLYISSQKYEQLGKFKLIWFTGVLYHNPEQLRFIQKLYDKLDDGGVLVLESATTRNLLLRNKDVVEIWFPDTYRNTQTISHLPSKGAIKSWLKMVGFTNISDSKCFNHKNFNVRNYRYACIALKGESSKPYTYYAKEEENPDYIIGRSI